jgi:UMF1 family MFS transporter
MSREITPLNDRRTIFGWCVYDWANSAYATTVLAGLLPAYFVEAVVGPDGVMIGGQHFRATTLWALSVAAAAIVVFLTAPVLGAVADFTAARKRFLLMFAYLGSLFTTLLYFCGSGDVGRTLAFFVLGQVGFVGANVFYDAFLPQIATADRMDRVSGWGYAAGYVGGGVQFALALLLILFHETLGIDQALAARIGLAMAGLWWAGFTIITALTLREAPATQPLPERYRNWPRTAAVAATGFRRTLDTARRVRHYRPLVLFLVAFMLYNDGIQTVIAMATIFGKEELRLSTADLMLTLLVIQGVAMVGALVFGRLAGWIGTKRAVMVSLVLWSGVVIYAYFVTSRFEYFALGGVVGIVLGGSQALSRSLYGSMVPPEASAEFFGFYTVFSKFSAIGGPLAMAAIIHRTGSLRLSIVSVVVFFVLGLVLLAFVNEQKARQMRTVDAHAE